MIFINSYYYGQSDSVEWPAIINSLFTSRVLDNKLCVCDQCFNLIQCLVSK